ncbi:MAG: tRNA uridine-5-carboxymethylaminomethyl(34) synthesis GTPase MnmE [bacterium]|nr:tRNA uridine-5-carboxymethylaminomethyl(34) synthesis GTPase MnmE [bacterium]
MNRPEETITAPATAPGEGALAVIRISGERAYAALQSLCADKSNPKSFKPRRLQYLHLHDHTGRKLDESMAVWFPGPRSFTGENMVEIHTHGGPVTVRALLEELYYLGLKAAYPGEFTFRAFLSGRIDLTQAEAVADLIHSPTDKARDLALDHLTGSMRRRIAPLREKLLTVLRDLEAGIDFVEEDINFVEREEIARCVESLRTEVEDLLAGAAEGSLIREGVSVVLAGAPNVGKSSIFNAILKEDRAIVTELPGTTRDVLKESWVHRGIVFHLQDTAGIRDTEEQVEKLGVARSEAALAASEVKVWIFDGTQPVSSEERIRVLGSADTLVVYNKSDLPGFSDDLFNGKEGPEARTVSVSAKTGSGLDTLKGCLYLMATEGVVQKQLGEKVAVNRRQSAKLQAIHSILQDLTPETLELLEEEVLARQMREALGELDELTGDKVGEEILTEIFANFCVGK